MSCAVWLYVITFATTKSKGRHYSSKYRKNFFLANLDLFYSLHFFSEISVYYVECCKFCWGIVPWRNKGVFLFNIWLCFGVLCTFIYMHVCCCKSICLLKLCLLSCVYWFPPANSSILQLIYLIIWVLFVSSLLKYQWSRKLI